MNVLYRLAVALQDAADELDREPLGSARHGVYASWSAHFREDRKSALLMAEVYREPETVGDQRVSFEYVRRYYGVDVRRGTKVKFEGRPARVMSATIYLHVRFTDGLKPTHGWLHPRWHVEYPSEVAA